MQRPLILALALVLAALIASAFLWFRGDAPPLAPISTPETLEGQPLEPVAAAVGDARAGEDPRAARESVAIGDAALLADPEIQAGLCGFRGRVVDHARNAVADCGVRIYRGALDSILPAAPDLFAPEPAYVPNYIAGETRTDAEGRWQLTGVWPRAFYLLFAGLGTDCPVHQIVTRTPAPGEIVDLGDIVLPNAGVIVGTVLDDEGEPLPGALVRAADLPGTLAAFFPAERFDPEGAVLVREPNFPQRVLEMPAWVKTAFDQLPIPSTRTGADGRFRLVGVTPGSNLLATTAPDFLSDMKPSVVVRAGQEKDVGTIRMKRGEELVGKVVDGTGKPVADAEVLAGSTLSMVPLDLARRLGTTDGEGRFGGQGFAPGKVTVAARRGRGHQWTLAEPQPIFGDVVVTLPTTFGVDVTARLADDKPATTARMQLLQGRAGNGAAEMFLLGFVPPIDLRDRRRELGDGRWRIDNLPPGPYTLIVDAPGHSHGFVTFELAGTDAAAEVKLTAPAIFTVGVVDPEDRPIRNAEIVAAARGTRAIEMPVRCGRTGTDGRLVIDKLTADRLLVSAEHPKWGTVHGEVQRGETIALRMQQPGALTGVIREHGKPPEPGKFTIVVERRGGGPRGALESTPSLLTPGLDGTFALRALQPGDYDVSAIKALDGLRSPGGIFTLAQEAFLSRNLPRERVTIASGQTTAVELEAGEKPIDGPTAQLAGMLTIDGVPAAGHAVTARFRDRRFAARSNERGRFDLGTVPAGELALEVLPANDGTLIDPNSALWAMRIELAANEARELDIAFGTSVIEGICILSTGEPAAGVTVRARGQVGEGKAQATFERATPADARGAFRFEKIAAGTWTLRVPGPRGGMRAELPPLTVAAGVPVLGLTIEVPPTTQVRGRVDMAAFGQQKPSWIWIQALRLKDGDGPEARGTHAGGIGVNMGTGAFDTEELAPGRYRLRMHAGLGDRQQAEFLLDDLIVPPGGLADVLLRPGRRVER